MPDQKISELTAKTSPDGTEEFPVNDSGATKKITLSKIIVNGDIPLTSFSGANDQSSNADVTGFIFNGANVEGFSAIAKVKVVSASTMVQTFYLEGNKGAAGWDWSVRSTGDNTNVSLFINSSTGQVEYTSDDYNPGFVSLTIKFRAWVIST